MVIAPKLGFWMEREMAVPEQSTGTDPVYGVMICGHGSRSKSAVTEFAVLAEKLAPIFPDWPVEYGYLEFATPVINTGLDKLRAKGVTHVLAVPGMLFAAGHAKNDIPSVLNAYAATVSYTHLRAHET